MKFIVFKINFKQVNKLFFGRILKCQFVILGYLRSIVLQIVVIFFELYIFKNKELFLIC